MLQYFHDKHYVQCFFLNFSLYTFFQNFDLLYSNSTIRSRFAFLSIEIAASFSKNFYILRHGRVGMKEGRQANPSFGQF